MVKTLRAPRAKRICIITHTASAAETIQAGKKFSRTISAGDVVILEGDLGAGKTTFIKGILQGMGYSGRVVSPSFTLVRQYRLKKLTLYHIDLYRLAGEELDTLGLDEYLRGPHSAVCIEWGAKAKNWLAEHRLITFRYTGETSRTISITKRAQ